MQSNTTIKMDIQPVTQELRDWIVSQASAGFDRKTLLASMLASGWQEAVALQTLEQTLVEPSSQKPSRAERPSRQASQPIGEAASQPLKVPEPLAEEGTYVVNLEGREVRVLSKMTMPRIVVFGGLLSDEECDELVELARDRLTRSQTVKTDTGGSEVHEARTSEGMFFRREENPLVARIEARIAALLEWPLQNGEGLQVLHYQPGAQYKPHYDYFDPTLQGTPAILKRGGQRVATLVMYLNTPTRGGATTFPDAQVEVAPMKGNAVFFSYDRPHPSTKTLHGGAPVIEGEKWVATKWLREREFT
jgi:prolyl 4-hydroxylase